MAASIGFDVFARDRASDKFNRVGNSAERNATKVSALGRAGRAMGKGIAIGAGIAAAGLVAYAASSVKSLARIERLNAQTENVIKSTGGAAGVTAKHIEDLTGHLENYTATEAESIQQGANMLATFTGIRNGAGKNNKIFDQSVRAITDMSRAMDTTGAAELDTSKQAVMLGKALNDPIKGVTALSKVGVSFTQGQKDQIKALVTSGKTMEAQKVILGELKKEFGGSGHAFAKTTAGQVALAGHAFGTLGETLSSVLMPPLSKVAGAVASTLNGMANDAGPAMAKLQKKLQPVIAWFESDLLPDIKKFGSELPSAFSTATTAATPFVTAMGSIATTVLPPLTSLVKVIGGLPGPVKTLGSEALIAALIFPRFAAGVGAMTTRMALAKAQMLQLRAEMSYTETRGAATSAMFGKVAGAAKMAAGVGGMLLLMNASKQTSKQLGTLEGAAGGAMLGFAAAGAPGAVIGGVAGALVGLASSTRRSANQFKLSTEQAQAYSSALDQVTGSASSASKAQILADLAKNGTLKAGLGAGLARGTLIDAALGKPAAIAQVNAAITTLKGNVKDLKSQTQDAGTNALFGSDSGKKALADNSNAIKKTSADTKALTSLIGVQARSYAKLSRDKLQDAAATGEISKAMGKIPPTLKTSIEAGNLPKTINDVASLNAVYHLTPKAIKTLLSLPGVDGKIADVKRLTAALKEAAQSRTATITVVRRGAAAQGKKNAAENPMTGGRYAGGDVGRYAAEETQRGAKRNNFVVGAAGASLITTLVAGINKKKVKLKNALDTIKSYAESTASALSDAVSERDSFASGFQSFGTSVFSDDNGGQPWTVASLLASQQSKAAQAASMADDVQSLISKGVSDQVLEDLQSSGASGLSQLHVLAGSDASSVAQFSALRGQEMASYNSAGMAAGNKIYGGNVANKAQADAIAQSIVNQFIANGLGGGDNVTIQLEGQTIVAAVSKAKKKRGQK